MKMRILTLTLYIAGITGGASVAAAVESPLTVEGLLTSAAEITTAAYPNADEALVDSYTFSEYQTNGASVTFDDTAIKVLTEKGKRSNRTLSFSFDLAYSTVIVEQVEIIRPDGTVVPIDIAEQSRVMIDSGQMSRNIYNPNSKVLRIGVPGLEIGDMVRYVHRRIEYKPRMPDTWSDYSIFEYTAPIVHSVYEIDAPAALPLCHTLVKAPVTNTVAMTKQEAGDRVIYRWEIKDVPRMFTEPSMPSLHTVVQRVLVSTIPDWETVSRWYYNLCEPKLEAVTPEMSNTVAELTQGLTNHMDTIKAVFHFVSQKVRYMGITTETEAPGYEPHDVCTTFENRYGVCRDKAALLVAMLRLAGVKAYPVLIYVGPKKDEEVPQPFFNHAIVCAEDTDGSYILMDPTDENTRELLPAYLCDKSYLVARADGDKLRVSPIIPAEENLMRIETSGVVDEAGHLTLETLLRFAGINDNTYRNYLSRLKPEERERFFGTAIKRVVPGARLVELTMLPEDLQDVSTALTVRLVYEADDVLVRGEEAAMLPPVWMGTAFGMVNFIIGQTGLEQRKYPLVTDYACGARETVDLDVRQAVGRPIAIPHFTQHDTTTTLWRMSLVMSNGVMHGDSDFRMKVVEFSPTEYLELKELLKEIEYDRRKRAVFHPFPGGAAAEADTRLLLDEITQTISDRHDLVTVRRVKREILTYAGKKDNSELKIGYNPVWDAVTIDYARVTAPDGTVKELAPEELNLMDAGWVGSAPRYPPGKTLVASLPGVDVSNVVEYQITQTAHDRPFLGMTAYFRTFEPVDCRTYELDAPTGLQLKMQATPGGSVPIVTNSSAGTVSYCWTVSNVPLVKTERNLPPWWYFNPGVMLSLGDWSRYAQEVRNALTAAAQGQPKAAAQARELCDTLTTPREKVIAIRDFIEKGIRSAGPDFASLPLSALTPADTTLADGYGNTSDRAILYHAMLSAAGFEPTFVLASGAPVLRDVANPMIAAPQRHLFDGVLVRVTVDGDAIYLNDTDQYAKLGTTPHDGMYGLDCADGEVITIAAVENCVDYVEMDYGIDIDADGNATITKTRRLYGGNYGGFHRLFAEMPPEERRRHHLEMIAGIAQSAKKAGELRTDYDTYPGVEEFTVAVERFAVVDGDVLYCTLPYGPTGLLRVDTVERVNPLYWSDDSVFTVRNVVTLPPGYRNVQVLPPNYTWQTPDGHSSVNTTCAVDDRGERTKLTIVHSINLEPSIIAAEDYDALFSADSDLAHPRMRTIMATRVGVGE